MKYQVSLISNLPLRASLVALLVAASGSMLLPNQSHADTIPIKVQVPVNTNILYVNPDKGINQSGGGTSVAPYKTITYALNIAPAGATIQLTPGTYNSNSGEKFPLVMKNKVALKGNESKQGQGILITGGGLYISPTFARQNITILTENGSVISGVSITNPNQRGTGVWIESTNPTISSSTFANSFREGVFVTGTGNPQIINNIFSQNRGNGISVAKAAQGEIRNNVFQNTGFGLAIGGKSTPLVAGNQIIQNKVGIYINESAKPILRNNVIQNNTQDGIVVTVNGLPDLGTSVNPGGNSIRNNTRYDLNNATRTNRILAIGNDINQKKILGSIDLFKGQ